jgi:hypothetical protein
MSAQGSLTRAPAAVLTAIPLNARLRDVVETIVFYGLVALGVGAPLVLGASSLLLR